MSNISNRSNVISYTSGVTKPFSGQRLSTVTYKTDKDTGIKAASKAVSIPILSYKDLTPAQITSIADSITGLMHKAQDAIVREFVEAGKTDIAHDDIGVDAIIEYLNESSESGRMTKVALASWFDANLADCLMIKIAERLGVSEVPTLEESNKVELMVATYKDKVSALAGGKTSYTPKLAKSLLDALAYAPSDDTITGKLTAKLVKMRDAAEVDLIDCL